jgi:integrase
MSQQGSTNSSGSTASAATLMTAKDAAKLAPSTVHKRLQVARGFFATMKRRGLIDMNPFEYVRGATTGSRDRQHFISREDFDLLMGACPNHDWRTIIALARMGGLRCPSEVLSLKLTDIKWDTKRIMVTSPKTEHIGKGTRLIPLFPELHDVLMEAAELAKPGAVYVVDEKYRRAACHETGWRNLNLRTTFQKIIRRSGLQPWPRLFHNLRASRETELVERFPIQVVTDWLGNTPKVAMKHYLMTTSGHFDSAVATTPKSVHKPVQQGARTTTNDDAPTTVNAEISTISAETTGISVTRLGLEPKTYGLPWLLSFLNEDYRLVFGVGK